MKYYAVIDTNVLVSAMLKWESVPGTVMSLIFDGPVIPIFNNEIIAEYRNVLSRPKFHLDEDIIENIISGITDKGILITAESLDINLPDPKDVVFYEVVYEKRKTENAYLVTGNIKHFPVKQYVVTPREFIDIILDDISQNEEQMR